jgi:hypothetical protein
VGDLLERTDSRGVVWFWSSVLQTAFSLFNQRLSANRFESMVCGASWAITFLLSNLMFGWKWRRALIAAISALIIWRSDRRKSLQQRPRL